eukprot:TRINITY_DN15789_c0_g1_i2.p1 TRINITY_DN15789_c0_g1~~TRINITY_DN15789_c0_g1_i2.p1  ORF type:complete len:367 (-),score=-23.06 TRINITY_DN15789_c0_g1_i2:109-1209(-)
MWQPELKEPQLVLLFWFLLICWTWSLLCRYLRRRRLSYLHSLAKNEHDTLALTKMLLYVEFPWLSNKALEFALFRTFAIPSISRLLHKTQQFNKSNVLKRYDDTALLIQEALLNAAYSPRGTLAVRRLNFLHGRYRISNDDFLFTLSLFVLEPPRFAAKFGYRPWTEKEIAAAFNVWKDIGGRMGIKGIPSTLDELRIFRETFEAERMGWAKTNQEIGDATLDLMLTSLPRVLRPLGRRLAWALMDERLLRAMGYPLQRRFLVAIVEFCARICTGWFVGAMMPPRPVGWSRERVCVGNGEEMGEEAVKAVHKVRFNVYGEGTYPDGYRIDELGNGSPGMLGHVYDEMANDPSVRSLRCPLSAAPRP